MVAEVRGERVAKPTPVGLLRQLLPKEWTHMRMTRKKLIAGIGTAVLVGGLATAAFAYWTADGSGSGSSHAAASNGALVLHASFPDGALYPGDTENVAFTADNAGDQAVAVGTIHAVVTTDNVNCDPADFTIADVAEGQNIAANSSGVALANGGTITMANTNVNQDACKGANITLTLSS
jgi:hypothetical protein